MTESEFIKLVTEMRQAQKEYFRTRKKGALIHAKELEIKVDGYLKTHNPTP